MIAPLGFSFAVQAAGETTATFPARTGPAFSRHVAPGSVAPATPFSSGVARLFASFDSLAATIPPLLPLPQGFLAGAIHLMGVWDWFTKLIGRGPAKPEAGPSVPTPPVKPPDSPRENRPAPQRRSRWDEGATGPVSASPSFEEREGARGREIVVIIPRGRFEELIWLLDDLDTERLDHWAHSQGVDRLILKFNKSGTVRIEGRLGSVGEDGRRLLMGRDIYCRGIFGKVAAHIASMTRESWDEGVQPPAPSPAQVEFRASGRQLVCVIPRGCFKEVRRFLPHETADSIDRLAATTGVDRLVLRVARGHIRVEGRTGGQGEGGRQFKMGKVVITGSDFENLVTHAVPTPWRRDPEWP